MLPMMLLWIARVTADYRVSSVDAEDVFPGNVAVLRCQVTGAGAEHVRVEAWTRDDGLTISASDGKHCVFPIGDLHVRGVDASDAGRRYRCRTTNALSRETRLAENWARITLQEPQGLSAPGVVHWLREVSVPADEGAWLPCVGRGWPAPSVRWWRRGLALEHEGGCAPLLRRASLSDAGQYECVVNNSVGEERVRTVLQVTADPPVIVSHFEDSVVSPGQPVSLRCVVRGRPLPRVEWRADGEPVAPSARVRLGDFVSGSAVHSFLNVSGAEPLDGGRDYECLAGGAPGHSARLEVRSPPIARPPRNKTLLAGRDANLGCPVAGYPLTRFAWEKDGVSLPSSHRHSLDRRGRLLIQQVEKGADDGTYWCEARGTGSAARGRLNIRVVVGPVIDAFSFPEGLREGRRVALACTVSAGDPPISFRWEKDVGGTVEDAHVEQLNPYTSTLFIAAAAPRHAGNYTCHAENPYASDKHTATLQLNIPPRWLVEPVDAGSVLGSPVRFDCRADGHPAPTTRWKQRGPQSDSFRTIVSGSRLQVLENGSLFIPEAGPGGPFLCQAQNGVGPGLSKLVHLALHVPAHFERKSSDKRVRRGEQATLECEAKGDKPIAITWYKAGETIDNGTDRYMVESAVGSSTLSRLVIGSAARGDSGRYSCTAVNAYGTDQHIADLTVQEPPDPPSGVEASHVSSRGALVRWSAPFDGHSPVLRYTVLIIDTGSSTEVPGSKVEAWLRGLRPRTLYGVQVRAENALGRSPPSPTLTLTTDDEVPRSPPSMVRVEPVSPTSLKVSWRPPGEEEEDGGTVTGYYVGYRSGTSQYLFKTLRGGGERECLLTGLTPSTPYQVKVQAFNEKGPGPHSDEVAANTLAEPPKNPEIEVVKITSDSIEIAWEPDMEGVSAWIRESGVGEWEEASVSARTHRFGGLRCGTEYQLYVSVGGRRSPTLTLATRGRAPVPPGEGFLSVNASSASVLLRGWGDGGCPPLTGYALRYRAREGGRWVEVPVQGRRAHLAGLSPGRWYKLVAGARNAAGETTVEFDFLTKQQVLPPLESSAVELQRRVAVITSAVCSAVVLVVILVAACAVLTRRRNRPPPEHTGERREVHKSAESVALSAWEKRTGGALYLPCPYEQQQHPYDLPVVAPPKIQ